LGGKKKKEDFFTALSKEEKLVGPRAPVAVTTAAPGAAAPADIPPEMHDKVFVSVDEKVVIQLDKEGGVKKVDIKGEMKVTIFDPDDAQIAIVTNGCLSGKAGFKCRLPPKINTAKYNSEGILQLKDVSKSFPVGSDNAPVILKWRKQTAEESEIPFSINFWPNSEDGKSVVSVEYEHVKEGLVLENVSIVMKCPSDEPPEVTNIDGDFQFDNRGKELTWQIPEISSDASSGTLEFSIPEVDDDDEFYPITIHFSSSTPYASPEVEVVGVTSASGDEDKDFNTRVSLTTEKFTIQ